MREDGVTGRDVTQSPPVERQPQLAARMQRGWIGGPTRQLDPIAEPCPDGVVEWWQVEAPRPVPDREAADLARIQQALPVRRIDHANDGRVVASRELLRRRDIADLAHGLAWPPRRGGVAAAQRPPNGRATKRQLDLRA